MFDKLKHNIKLEEELWQDKPEVKVYWKKENNDIFADEDRDKKMSILTSVHSQYKL